MTHFRTINRPQNRASSNFADDFFLGFPSPLGDEVCNFKTAMPVNITESETGYQLEIVTPGFAKEDIKVDLDSNLLTISVEKKAEESKGNVKNIRTEYKYQAAKRTFTIDEQVDANQISANYSNGILTLQLPKKVKTNEAVKQINIQ